MVSGLLEDIMHRTGGPYVLTCIFWYLLYSKTGDGSARVLRCGAFFLRDIGDGGD